MSRQLCLLALMALAAPPAVHAQQPAAGAVRAVDSAWTRSCATHDTALALAVFAPELIVTSGSGAPSSPG